MSETTEQTRPSISTNRFFLYVTLGILAFILIVVGLGATLTRVLWPIDKNLSHPVMTPEEKI